MQDENTQILEQIALVNLDVHVWTGRKKLRPEDFKAKSSNIPPSRLASLGSKRIVDPSRVAKFEALKRRAERLLSSAGIRMMGTYAVPADQADRLVDELKLIKAEYLQAKQEFIASYDESISQWIQDQQEWGDIIRNAVTPVSKVKNQLSFGWQVFHIKPAEVSDSGLDDQVDGLTGQLYAEISRDALWLFERSFLMKTKVSQKSIKPLRELQKKLKGLSFLDKQAAALATFFGQVLDQLPQKGSIEGDDLNKIFGLLVVMTSPSKIEEYGQALASGQSLNGSDLLALSGNSTSSLSTDIEPSSDADESSDATESEPDSIDDDDFELEVPDTTPRKPAVNAPTWF